MLKVVEGLGGKRTATCTNLYQVTCANLANKLIQVCTSLHKLTWQSNLYKVTWVNLHKLVPPSSYKLTCSYVWRRAQGQNAIWT